MQATRRIKVELEVRAAITVDTTTNEPIKLAKLSDVVCFASAFGLGVDQMTFEEQPAKRT
jgi:hypothetical protein